MADRAGLYNALWQPNENGMMTAKDLTKPIEDGLIKMKSNPSYFKQFNASNGWGTYDQFIPWIEEYLAACKENPTAEVSTSR